MSFIFQKQQQLNNNNSNSNNNNNNNNNNRDNNYEILKKEIKQLSEQCKQITQTLPSYCLYLKELYLSPNSINNNITKYYDNQHPLSKYSNNILRSIEIEISNWETTQFNQIHQQIQDFQLSLNQIIVNIDKFDKESSIINNNSLEQKKRDYINLKSQIFNDSKLIFDNKIECFDKPLINIQFSFNSLLYNIQSILNNSSQLLQSNINNNNPTINLIPNNDFLNNLNNNNINNRSNLDGASPLPLSPSPTVLKRPPSINFNNNNNNNNTTPQTPSQSILKPNNSTSLKPSPLKPSPLKPSPLKPSPLKPSPLNNNNIINNNNNKSTGFSQFKRSEENIRKSNIESRLRNVPPLDILVNDYEYHKLLWDNKRYKLVKTFNYSINVVYDFEIKYPKESQFTLHHYTAIPKTIQNQFIRNTSIEVYDGSNGKLLNEIQPTIIESNHQNLWYYLIKGDANSLENHHLLIKHSTDLDLYKVELKEVTDPNEVIQVEPITEQELEVYLRPTDKLNFNTPEFDQFIQDNQFYPKQFEDGTMECILAFAYRIYLYTLKNFTYKWPHTLSGKPIETFNAGYGDCGCHSFFFTSILRYNNIPVRLLFGRGADINNNEDQQYHVKTDIYIAEIGWVPIEVTCKDMNGNHTHLFTKDCGTHITFGIDYFNNIGEISKYAEFTSYQLMNIIHFIHKGQKEEFIKQNTKLFKLTNSSTQDQLNHINNFNYNQPNKQSNQQSNILQRSTSSQQQQQQQAIKQTVENKQQKQSIFNNFANSLSNSISKDINNRPTTITASLNNNKSYRHTDMPPAPKSIEQLINDRTIHSKLWDNKRFKLVKNYKRSVSINFISNLKFSSTSQISNISAYIPVPPNINNQIVRDSSALLYDANNGNLLKEGEIINSYDGQLYKLEYSNNKSTNFNFNETINLDLYSIEMVQVTDPNETIQVEPITEQDIDRYLRSNIPMMNMETNEFNRFIESNQLYPLENQDGTLESILCFAYRVNLFILKTIQYKSPYGHDGSVNNIIKSKCGDCFCHSILYAAILRRNNILCRILFGRIGNIDDIQKKGKEHCKVEIYEQNIGWIPIDVTLKSLVEYNTALFGIDEGDFISFSLDYFTNVPSCNEPYAFQDFYFNYSSFNHSNVKIESRSNNSDLKPLQPLQHQTQQKSQQQQQIPQQPQRPQRPQSTQLQTQQRPQPVQPIQSIQPQRPQSIQLQQRSQPVQPIQPQRPPPPQQQQQQQQNKTSGLFSSKSLSGILSSATRSFNSGLPTSIHVDQLINNHEIHKKLWDKRFKLVKKYNYSVSTLYTKKITFNQNSNLKEVKLYFAVPLTINNQTIKYSSFTLHDINDQCIAQSDIVKSSLHDVYCLSYKPTNQNEPKQYTFKYRIDVDLYSVAAEEVTNPNEAIEVEPITQEEIDLYLRPTNLLDFDTPEFQQFIESNKLYPLILDDGQMESILCFAYRVSLYIYKNIKYKFPHGHSAKPLDTVKLGYGDCGCHSNLFASILRYNNIPCRNLYGRGGLLGKEPDQQIHVKNQFYVSGLGWTGYDGAYKDGNAYHKKAFNNDFGTHITSGLDFYTNIETIKSNDFFIFQNNCFYYWGSDIKYEISNETYNVYSN